MDDRRSACKTVFDRRDLAVCGLLLLAVALAFGRTIRYGFVNYDDDVYVYDNSDVTGGLTASGMHWAFCESHDPSWVPLTWISLMIDCDLYGSSNAGGFHLTNVLLHAAAAVVLFLVLRRMTGQRWPSALAAMLFAVHPLRVESVAWVTERKDVLSGLFFVLTLAAYLAYVRRPSILRYAAVAVLFTFGLLAKQMLVTLPFVLLLLDYWPLGRSKRGTVVSGQWPVVSAKSQASANPKSPISNPSSSAYLLLEKLPLFALSAAACGMTVWMSILANHPRDNFPIWWRVGNAMIACVTYLWQMLYPVDLVVIRPLPDPVLSPWAVFGSASILAVITIAVWLGRRKYPYLPVGWFWYLGMLAPVMGVVQYGIIAVSDRFTYLPQIGLCIAVSWGMADICRAWPRCRPTCVAAAVGVVLVFIACAFHQTSYWRDSETLWHHAIDCTDDNYVAELNLGVSLNAQKRYDEAKPHIEKAMQIKRDHVIGNRMRDASKYGRDVDKTIEQYWKDAVPPKRDSMIPNEQP
jgi:hypothetical protein